MWMSMGKCSLLRMISWFLPVNLLALLMLLVCQSVQYRLSSNTVMANGWGRPEDTKNSRSDAYSGENTVLAPASS